MNNVHLLPLVVVLLVLIYIVYHQMDVSCQHKLAETAGYHWKREQELMFQNGPLHKGN